jgi:hypothetical protein
VTDVAPALAPETLERIAAAQADWVRRHRRVAVACAAGLLVLVAALAVVLLIGTRDTVHPQAVVGDGVLIGVVGSALAGAIAQTRHSERARRLAIDPPPPVACVVSRLAADTKKRPTHIRVRLAGSTEAVLLRVDDGEDLRLLPEDGDGVLLGVLNGRGPVLVGVPGRRFVAARKA